MEGIDVYFDSGAKYKNIDKAIKSAQKYVRENSKYESGGFVYLENDKYGVKLVSGENIGGRATVTYGLENLDEGQQAVVDIHSHPGSKTAANIFAENQGLSIKDVRAKYHGIGTDRNTGRQGFRYDIFINGTDSGHAVGFMVSDEDIESKEKMQTFGIEKFIIITPDSHDYIEY